MSGIDQRVVQMMFDNKEFESGIKTTLSSLDALNKGLKLEGATKGLNDVNTAASKFSLAGISNGIQSIADKFKALSIIGIAALSSIVTKAVDAGLALTHSLTTQPIIDGLHEYETNLNSIQTVLANTGLIGQEGLNKVNAALQQLNTYSDQTIYNFSEMARNIGTFTAAGVTLDVATSAIKGIANLAAISGSSAQQASTAMYQLSQAISAGKVTLEDWNSVVNAGMGGKVFQNALMETARIHGVAIDKMVKDAGSFRLTLQNGWLTGQILTETLSKFTGDLTAAQLKTMGYNDQQIAGILQMAKTAQEAATKIKTFSQLLSTLQEAAGSGWATTWQLIFGDFDEAKSLFTDVNNVLGGFIQASAKARNSVLGDWKELGGRTVVIEAISNAFHALIDVLTPIKQAFRDIFPATTGKQLYDLSVSLRNFTAGLKIGADTADKLHRTFAGVFAVIGIGIDVIKAIVSVIGHLAGVALEGSGGFLEFTARIGDFLVGMREAIHNGEGFTAFFKALGDVLAIPIKIIRTIATAIGSIFSGFNGGDAAKTITDWASKLNVVTTILEAIASGGDKVNSFIAKIGQNFKPMIDKIVGFFSSLGDRIKSALSGVDFGDVLGTINTGLFAGLVVTIKSFVDKFKSGDSGLQGIVDTIKETFSGLTSTLSTMQNTLRAATLLEIAAAVGILTISCVALSKIDSDGLTRALIAISVMFTQLFTSMAIFNKVASSKGFAKMTLVTAAMILLAIAVDLLTIAVRNLSELNWDALSKGLTGLTVILAELIVTMRLMPNEGKMISSGLSMIALAAAINILVSAVTTLSGLSWSEMARGLTGVGALLVALTLFTKFSEADKGGILQGAGLVLLAAGIKILASAVQDMSGMSWTEIAKGLVTLAVSLALIVAALILIPPTAPLAALGVLGVAISLGMIADALQQMGSMSWGTIGKGLVALLASLTIIAAALYVVPPTAPLSAAGILIVALSLKKVADVLAQLGAMSWMAIGKSLAALAGAMLIIAVGVDAMAGSITGAAAVLIVAAALAVLAPVLMAFGSMSWEAIGKGLLTLAGVFVILGVAGLVLAPIVPILIGLGIAVTLLGAGMLLAGAGVLAFSIGLTALSVAGAAGAAAIVGIVTALVGLIPTVMTQIGLGVIAFAQVIANSGTAITAAMTTVLMAIIDAINTNSPKIMETLATLLQNFLQTMANHVPQMVDAGLRLLTGVLNGIANNIHNVVTAATNIIVNFLHGIADNLPRVIQAGVDLIFAFIHGLTNAINQNSEAMGRAGGDLALAIVRGMISGIRGGIGQIADAARNAAKSALDAAKSFLGINSPSKEFIKVGKFSAQGMANGLDALSGEVASSAEDLGKEALGSLKNSLTTLADTITGPIDLYPTITPVLDLSDVKRNAGQIGDLFTGKSITVGSSVNKANNASTQFDNNQIPPFDPTNDGSPGNNGLTFNQYNNSPKALTPAEIYRQTKNQLSVAKGALTKADA